MIALVQEVAAVVVTTELRAPPKTRYLTIPTIDFFVTAYSLVDWTANSTPGITVAERDKLRAQLREPMIVKICADVANGTKHFLRDRKPHSTATTHSAPPAFQPDAFSQALQVSWSAWLELSEAEAHAASIPRICPIDQLAEAVLGHWKRDFEGSL